MTLIDAKYRFPKRPKVNLENSEEERIRRWRETIANHIHSEEDKKRIQDEKSKMDNSNSSSSNVIRLFPTPKNFGQ